MARDWQPGGRSAFRAMRPGRSILRQTKIITETRRSRSVRFAKRDQVSSLCLRVSVVNLAFLRASQRSERCLIWPGAGDIPRRVVFAHPHLTLAVERHAAP